MMDNEIFSLLKSGTDQQLICFPYLGGYANSFLSLTNHLNDDIEVWSCTPPGHGGSSLPPFQDLSSLLAHYFRALKEIIKPNCVFYGHSMGGIVGYFLLQDLLSSNHYPIKPRALVLSGCNPPSYFKGKQTSLLPGQDLIHHLQTYGGIPKEVLQEEGLINYFLPMYRADFKILENSADYDYQPLTHPVYFLWGEKDNIVPLENVLKWTAYFTNNIHLLPIAEGTHMFIETKAYQVAKSLEKIFADLS